MSKFVIAKYIRLSTDDSYSDSLSIDNQRTLLDRHISALNLDGADILEFVDNGYSGTNFERPAVSELLGLVTSGGVNCIIVKDFSRFGRNSIETGYFLERVFPLYGVRFISVSDHFDSDEHKEDTGGLLVSFKFLLHEQYSRDLSRKIKTAKHERMKRGELLTKACAFGYLKTADNRLAVCEQEAKIVRQIFRLALERKSLAQICELLYMAGVPTPSAHRKKKAESTDSESGIWNKSQLLKILHDEQYIGTYVAGKTRVDGVAGKTVKVPPSEWYRIPHHHEAIIEQSIFETVQTIIDEKGAPLRNRKLATNKRYADAMQSPLKGKVYCGCCGHIMRITCTKNARFECAYTRAARDAECFGLQLPKPTLEAMVYDKICDMVGKHKASLSTPAGSVSQAEVQSKVEAMNTEKRSLYECFVLGELNHDEYLAQKRLLDGQLNRLSHVKSKAEKSKTTLLAELGDLLAQTDTLNAALVDALVGKVRVYPGGTIEIDWKHHLSEKNG